MLEFKGFTVDERLREFRKVTWKKGEPDVEYVPFDSKKGSELLRDLLRSDKRLRSKLGEWKGRFIVLPEGPGMGGGTGTA